MVSCHQCSKGFADYEKLALHIMTTKGHRKGRRWAAHYVMINGLSPKNRRDLPERAAENPDKERTEFGDENRQNMRVILSGREKHVIAVCPKCKGNDRVVLPEEYATSVFAWRMGGTLTKLCARCGRY